MGHGSDHWYRYSNHSDSRRESSRNSESNSYNSKYKPRQPYQRDSNHISNSERQDPSHHDTNRTNSINSDKDKSKNDNFDIISGLSSQLIWDERPDVEQLLILILSIINWLDSDNNEQFGDESVLFEKIIKNKARISSILHSIPHDIKSIQNVSTETILLKTSILPQELQEAKRIRSQISVYDSFAKSISKLDNANDIQTRIEEQEKSTKETKERCDELRKSFVSLHESIHKIRTSLSDINI